MSRALPSRDEHYCPGHLIRGQRLDLGSPRDEASLAAGMAHIDGELDIERSGEPHQGFEPGVYVAAFQSRDLRLLHVEQLRQVALGEPAVGAVAHETQCDRPSDRGSAPLGSESWVGQLLGEQLVGRLQIVEPHRKQR